VEAVEFSRFRFHRFRFHIPGYDYLDFLNTCSSITCCSKATCSCSADKSNVFYEVRCEHERTGRHFTGGRKKLAL